MASVNKCCVNLSGISWTVYDGNNNIIGAIEPREFFTFVGFEGSLQAIYFLSPSGSRTGYLHGASGAVFTEITNRPHTTINHEGITYKAFIMRQTMALYDIYGTVVGSVAAGKLVLCQTGMSGSSMPYLKAINYAEKRAGGWEPMGSHGTNYGFVDTGLRNSSSYSGIALYGNW